MMILKFYAFLISTNIIVLGYALLFLTSLVMIPLIDHVPPLSDGHSSLNEFMPLYATITFPMLLSLILFPLLLEKSYFQISLKQLGFTFKTPSKAFSIALYAFVLICLLNLFAAAADHTHFLYLSFFLAVQCLGEDVLFRSVLQRRMHEHFSAFTTILITTVIFVFIFHNDSFIDNLLFRVPLGLLMSFIFYKTRSIFPVFAIHFLNNLYYSLE